MLQPYVLHNEVNNIQNEFLKTSRLFSSYIPIQRRENCYMQIIVFSWLRSRHGRAWSFNFGIDILWIVSVILIFSFLSRRLEILLILPSKIFPILKLQWCVSWKQQVCSLGEITNNLCKRKNQISKTHEPEYVPYHYLQSHLYIVVRRVSSRLRELDVLSELCRLLFMSPISWISYYIDTNIQHVIVLSHAPINDIPRIS